MDGTTAFWWTWSVNVATAAGTLGAVVVALFGAYLRALLFPPKLRLRLVNPLGIKTQIAIQGADETQRSQASQDARYYHLRANNLRRWSPANHAQVFLLQVEEPGLDGALRTVWVGEVPIRWRHQEVHPLARTLGSSADCDLIRVVRDRGLSLLPLVRPFNLSPAWTGPTRLMLSVQVRANETDSPIERISVAWDGAWEDGQAEMGRHLAVKQMVDQ